MITRLFPKEPVFGRDELLRFANIFDNGGQVFLAGLVISPFFSNVDFDVRLVVTLGLVLTFGCWIVSWWLTRESNKL